MIETGPVSAYARIGTFYRDMEVDDRGLILVNWENKERFE
jgi:hypothetical protein